MFYSHGYMLSRCQWVRQDQRVEAPLQTPLMLHWCSTMKPRKATTHQPAIRPQDILSSTGRKTPTYWAQNVQVQFLSVMKNHSCDCSESVTLVEADETDWGGGKSEAPPLKTKELRRTSQIVDILLQEKLDSGFFFLLFPFWKSERSFDEWLLLKMTQNLFALEWALIWGQLRRSVLL